MNTSNNVEALAEQHRKAKDRATVSRVSTGALAITTFLLGVNAEAYSRAQDVYPAGMAYTLGITAFELGATIFMGYRASDQTHQARELQTALNQELALQEASTPTTAE